MRAVVVLAALGALAVAAAPQQQPPAPPPPGLVRAGEYRLGAQVADATRPPGGSVYDVGPFPLSPPELPPGDGRDATVAMCSVCHSLRYITMQPPLPPDTWRAIVRKMIDVHGAAIPEDVAGRITQYLQLHFSPAVRQPPDKPPAS